MKSSTIRRSNLSKEKIAVLEALSKFNNTHENDIEITEDNINTESIEDGSPEVYVRPSKEKELDLLWKDFRIPKGDHSPIVYLGMGFAAGVITTLLVSAFIGMSSGNFHFKSHSAVEKTVAPIEATVSNQEESAVETTEAAADEDTTTASKGKKFGLFGSNNNSETSAETSAAPAKEYEVQSGDTMEKIVRQFYGSYSGEKVEAIMNLNKMEDANKLSIGQKLLLPSEGLTTSAQ